MRVQGLQAGVELEGVQRAECPTSMPRDLRVHCQQDVSLGAELDKGARAG